MSRQAFEDAERCLFRRYGLVYESRSLALDDPAVSIGVRECGAGRPVVFIHGSGTSLGAMWALCFALEAPERVVAVVAIGMPAVALPGVRGGSVTGGRLRERSGQTNVEK
jgi:pimeloyl-ACP methyl ester carboxylesterase